MNTEYNTSDVFTTILFVNGRLQMGHTPQMIKIQIWRVTQNLWDKITIAPVRNQQEQRGSFDLPLLLWWCGDDVVNAATGGSSQQVLIHS